MTVTTANSQEFIESLVTLDPNLRIQQDGPCFGYLESWTVPNGDGELILNSLKVRLSSKIEPLVNEHRGVEITYELFEPAAIRARFPQSFND